MSFAMQDTLVIASDPKELVEAQHRMIAAVESKLGTAIAEAKDAHDVAETIVRSGARLGLSAAKRLHKRATSRVAYLTKCASVLRAGYVMMPDMPGEIVAVRTNRVNPTPNAVRWWKGYHPVAVPELKADGSPEGQGDYFAPTYQTETRKRQIDAKRHDGTTYKDSVTEHRAIALRDADGIDRRFLRAEVMTRTAAAMTMRAFDEIATVTPQATSRGRRGGDPIVLGRIVDPENGKVAAFMIAHFIDTAEL